MPPTRGHDLKLAWRAQAEFVSKDAPHTGARLETSATPRSSRSTPDAPHTGARLETEALHTEEPKGEMPPTRGHDLKPGSWGRRATG